MVLFDKQQRMNGKVNEVAIAAAPEKFRETYGLLLDAEDAGDMQEVLRLAEILEKAGADEILWAFQKAMAYLEQDKPKLAEHYIDKLYEENPDNQQFLLTKAICRQQNGDIYQAEQLLERIYPPEEYNPFYYSAYGSVLEERKKWKAAYEKYKVAYEHYLDNYNPGDVFMDGIFQRMIELDMALKQDSIEEDVNAYASFLRGIENTEEWQYQVSENLVLFSQYMAEKKNRQPLYNLLNSLSESGFMTSPIRLRELHLLSHFPEICTIIDDPKISKFTAELVKQTMLSGIKEDEAPDEILNITKDMAEEIWDAQTEVVMLKYYAEKRLPGILEEFEYIRSFYPYTYEMLTGFADELRENPRKTTSKYREILRERLGEEKITNSSLDKFYKETYESGKVMWSSDEGSYVRTEKKVGRNDPCPCGSGKKYKHCCGRK